jgi:hypothetical protein
MGPGPNHCCRNDDRATDNTLAGQDLRPADWRIDRPLVHAERSVVAVLGRDGQWYAGRRFDNREQAIAHADNTRADLGQPTDPDGSRAP